MKTPFSRHRAALGLVSVAATPVFFALPTEWPASESGFWMSRLILTLIWLICGAGIMGSPYWKIVYREAPLKRAITGVSNLDERELALRDRANGLTYYLFAVANMLLIVGVGIAVDLGWLVLNTSLMLGAVIPYFYFAISLPVIMLEWFEPSDDAPHPVEEEEQ